MQAHAIQVQQVSCSSQMLIYGSGRNVAFAAAAGEQVTSVGYISLLNLQLPGNGGCSDGTGLGDRTPVDEAISTIRRQAARDSIANSNFVKIVFLEGCYRLGLWSSNLTEYLHQIHSHSNNQKTPEPLSKKAKAFIVLNGKPQGRLIPDYCL
ncbi:MAG: hypothetical protein AAGF98_00250 [Cyanobacteria bacterium P01_H01_bin.153]